MVRIFYVFTGLVAGLLGVIAFAAFPDEFAAFWDTVKRSPPWGVTLWGVVIILFMGVNSTRREHLLWLWRTAFKKNYRAALLTAAETDMEVRDLRHKYRAALDTLRARELLAELDFSPLQMPPRPVDRLEKDPRHYWEAFWQAPLFDSGRAVAARLDPLAVYLGDRWFEARLANAAARAAHAHDLEHVFPVADYPDAGTRNAWAGAGARVIEANVILQQLRQTLEGMSKRPTPAFAGAMLDDLHMIRVVSRT